MHLIYLPSHEKEFDSWNFSWSSGELDDAESNAGWEHDPGGRQIWRRDQMQKLQEWRGPRDQLGAGNEHHAGLQCGTFHADRPEELGGQS